MTISRNVGINGTGCTNTDYTDNLANVGYYVGVWQVTGVNVATDAVGNPTVAAASSYLFQAKLGCDGVYNIAFNCSVNPTIFISFGSATISNQVFSGGLVTATLTVPVSSGKSNSNIQFNYSGATGGIQNFFMARTTESLVYNPVALGTFAGPTGQVTAATFRSIIPAGTTLRNMDASYTNFTTNALWSQRNTLAVPAFFNGPTPRQTPWEIIIRMCNELGVHAWINIPVNAVLDSTYFTNLANLCKYGSDGTNAYTSVQSNPVHPPLAQGLNLYIEYNNEIWNTVTPLFNEILKQTATCTIPLTGLSVTGNYAANVAIYQGASLGTATWSGLTVGNTVASGANSGTAYVSNEVGTYAPGAVTINTATPITGTGAARTASTDAVAIFLDTNFKNDVFGNLYKKHTITTLLISEAFRTVWGASDMPENSGRVRPLLMAQQGFDAGPLATMLQIFSPILDNSNGLSLTIPGVTNRKPNNYIYGLGCAFYYSPGYTTGKVSTIGNAVATGTAVTFTFDSAVTLIPVGSTVITSGFNFGGTFTNGYYTVTASTVTSVTIASTATGSNTGTGSVTFFPNGAEDLFGNNAVYDYTGYGKSWAATARWAATYGVKFCAYEGFLSYSVFPVISSEFALGVDSRVIPKILNFANAWDQAGGDLCCAFTIDALSISNWSMIMDQRNPTASSKYTAWLATQSIPRANATIWPSRGYTIPGSQFAARLDAAFVSSGWLTSPQPTGGLACTNGYFISYVWYCQDKFYAKVVANITATVAGTVDFYVNGNPQSTAVAVTVGTNNYNVAFNPVYSEGPLVSAAIHWKTGSGGTINNITLTQ